MFNLQSLAIKQRINILRLFSFLIILFFSLSVSNLTYALTSDNQVSAQAEKHLQATQNRTLIIGSEQDFPPFATGMTDETAGGFTVELWKAVAAEAGLNFHIRVLPFAELLHEFKAGKIDVLINLNITDETHAYANFSVPHATFKGGIFVRKNESSINSEADLNGKSIIMMKDDVEAVYATSRGWGNQLVLVQTAEEGMRLLASGKHDVMLINKVVGLQTLVSHGLTNIKALKVNAGFTQKFAFAVHRGDSALLEQINEAFAVTIANRTYHSIYEKWFGAYSEKEIGLRDLLKYIIPIILLFSSVLAYSLYLRWTERKQAENELKIAAIAFESQEGIMVTDANNVILRVNHAFTKITGYSADDAIGKTPRLLSSGKQDKAFYMTMWESINDTGAWEGEIWNRRKSGEIYPEHLAITAVKNAEGSVTNYVATHTDITMSKAASEEIKHLAFYDQLTQLPNRRLLLDRLNQALAASARNGHRGALLFMDLDYFKTLNDTLGHDVGDVLLQQVAARLSASIREGDTVSRLGGDEFVVLLEDLSEEKIEAAAQTKDIAEKILLAFNQPYQLNTHTHHSTASIGATLFNGHEQAPAELLKQADIAMYQSKTEGRNTLRFFDPKMQEAITARAGMEQELRKAITQKQFELHYQIQVGSRGQAVGVEALIRWHHPERGMISPFNFIPLAEESGLILCIGQWVLESACAQLKAWQHNPLTQDLVISINVSAKQFFQVGFVEQVLATVEHHAINPAHLKLELTESMLVNDINDIIAKMKALSQVGIRFSLDDFGTGYSSLQYLKMLPIGQLKIDQSFVRDIATDAGDRAIVRTIITMAHSLDINVIAEGVETQEQRQYLLDSGCTHYQGYLFSKPMPIEEFEALLKKAD